MLSFGKLTFQSMRVKCEMHMALGRGCVLTGSFPYLAEVGCFLKKNIFSVAEAAESGMVCEKQVGPWGW